MADDGHLDWECFLELLCECDDSRESVLYKFLIENFPIQFMQKLLSTAVDEDLLLVTRERATFAIHYMHDFHNLLEENYFTIDAQAAMESLRRNAMRLMLDNERLSILQMCGQETVFRLLRLSLESDERWDEYIEFAEESFTGDSPDSLGIFLMNFNALRNSDLRHKLMRYMKPFITRNSAQFEAIVVQLLHEEEEDSYPFVILPSIIHIFNRRLPPAFTEAAIMSHFFYIMSNYGTYEMLRVAAILECCIEHTSPFQLSDAANQRMVEIIFRIGLANAMQQQSTRNAAENMAVATRLLNAFLKKHDESVVIFVVVFDISEVEE